MRKLVGMLAAASLCVAFAAAPAAAGNHERDHGPNPLAAVGVIFGAHIFVISVPFTALIAPTHIGDSFKELVMRPVAALIGAPAPAEPCLIHGTGTPTCKHH